MKHWLLCTSMLIAALTVSAQYIYHSPIDGSEFHHPETNIILRTSNQVDASSLLPEKVLVVGDVSGVHQVEVQLVEDQRTILIQPTIPFDRGERIEAHVQAGFKTMDGVELAPISLEFWANSKQAEHSMQLEEELPPYSYERGGVPANFPTAVVNVNTNPAPGKLFFRTNPSVATDRFMAITDNTLVPEYWSQSNQAGQCWSVARNGYLIYFDRPNAQFMMLDSSYVKIDSFACGNGYSANGHEFQILPNGHSYLMVYDEQVVDMSQIVTGGNPNALVTGLVLQELDPNKNVIFQWRSWDHFQITDAWHADFTSSNISAVHGNAIEIDTDGNMMISCRALDEITKIDLNNGNVIWRWGGLNNEFTLINDTLPFDSQHDIRRLPNGNVTLYDNGKYHSPQISSAREYTLDEVNKTATLVWEYYHPQNVYGRAMGNVQRLPNGNTWINWGWVVPGQPNFTEVDINDNIVFEATFDDSSNKLYRSYRTPWNPLSTEVEEEATGAETVMAYPNPANEQVTLQFELTQQTATIVWYNALGKVMEQQQVTGTGMQNLVVNTAQWKKGVYLYQLYTETATATGKVAITH